MKYFFCIDIPWENTYIECFDSYQELTKDNEEYMKNNKDWFIIKGDIINYAKRNKK